MSLQGFALLPLSHFAPVIAPILLSRVYFQILTVLNIYSNVQMYCTTVTLTIPIILKQYWSNYWGNQWGRGQSAKPNNDIPSIHYHVLNWYWPNTTELKLNFADFLFECCVFYADGNNYLTFLYIHKMMQIKKHANSMIRVIRKKEIRFPYFLK